MNFSIKDFFGKCDQICRKLRIWLHLPKKYLMEIFMFLRSVLSKDVIIFVTNYHKITKVSRKILVSSILNRSHIGVVLLILLIFVLDKTNS